MGLFTWSLHRIVSNRPRNAARRLAPTALLRLTLLAAAVAGATAATAQQQDTPSLEQLESLRSAACAQPDADGRCPAEADPEDATGAEPAASTHTLDIAHKAAIRQREVERRALRELLLQRACNNRKAYCAQNAAPGCAEQLAQMCTAVAQQAAACAKQAVAYCATFPQIPNCVAQRQAQCPSAKRQRIDVLLAKYPQLSAQQVEHVKNVARQIDANLGSSWVGDLFRWLGFGS